MCQLVRRESASALTKFDQTATSKGSSVHQPYMGSGKLGANDMNLSGSVDVAMNLWTPVGTPAPPAVGLGLRPFTLVTSLLRRCSFTLNLYDDEDRGLVSEAFVRLAVAVSE